MKTKRFFYGLLILGVATVFSTQSCSKQDNGSISSTDISLAQDDAYASALFDEVDDMVVTEVANLDASGYSTNAKKSFEEDVCRTVTVDHPDSTTFPKVITIDYGTGCSVVFNGDTITRAGQIVITITNRWWMEGAQHSVSFNNFYMNGAKIEGTRIITNMGINAKRHLELGIELKNGQITFQDGTVMTREANHVREWARTFNPMNDTVFVSGTANGVNILGETYSRTIIDPLVMVHCPANHMRWVTVGGSIEITNSERGTTTIDFTGNDCDSNVRINKDGYRYNYKFRYRNSIKGGN